MPSPKKAVQPMETDIEEEIMESGGSPVESDMNVDTPAPSEDISSSVKTGESVPSEEVSASTGSTRSDLQDAGSLVTTEGSASETMSPGGCAPKSFFDCIKGTGRKPSPNKGGAESSRQEGNVVSPKSKGKPRTPKKEEKSSKQSVSPGQGATLSPKAADESEKGEATESRRASPMKCGKPGFLRRLLSPAKDKQGDQRISLGHDYHEDAEQAEDVPLTAVVSPKGSGKAKKSLLERLGLKSEPKRAAEIPPELRGELVAKVEEKVNPEDASDCTVSTSLSPSSSTSERRGDGTESIYLETGFDVPQLELDEQKTSSEETPKSTPGSAGDSSSSGAASGELPVDQPATEAEEATNDGKSP